MSSGIPFRFNPRRHKRLLRLTKLRRAFLLIHVVCLSFLFATAVMAMRDDDMIVFAVYGLIATVLSGVGFGFFSRELKREHR